MSARDVIASELARISRVDMDEAPVYARASVRTAALHVERALTAAGYRIIGPDEIDPVTLAAGDRWLKQQYGIAPRVADAERIRSLGEGR